MFIVNVGNIPYTDDMAIQICICKHTYVYGIYIFSVTLMTVYMLLFCVMRNICLIFDVLLLYHIILNHLVL